MNIEKFKELLRNTLKYFGHMIRDEIEWVEGLENFNIDNKELEQHYDILEYYLREGGNKLQKLYDDFLERENSIEIKNKTLYISKTDLDHILCYIEGREGILSELFVEGVKDEMLMAGLESKTFNRIVVENI